MFIKLDFFSKILWLIWFGIALDFFLVMRAKKKFNMFRLTLSLVGTWPAKILKFRLGSWEAGKFPVGATNFAQHWLEPKPWQIKCLWVRMNQWLGTLTNKFMNLLCSLLMMIGHDCYNDLIYFFNLYMTMYLWKKYSRCLLYLKC